MLETFFDETSGGTLIAAAAVVRMVAATCDRIEIDDCRSRGGARVRVLDRWRTLHAWSDVHERLRLRRCGKVGLRSEFFVGGARLFDEARQKTGIERVRRLVQAWAGRSQRGRRIARWFATLLDHGDCALELGG